MSQMFLERITVSVLNVINTYQKRIKRHFPFIQLFWDLVDVATKHEPLMKVKLKVDQMPHAFCFKLQLKAWCKPQTTARLLLGGDVWYGSVFRVLKETFFMLLEKIKSRLKDPGAYCFVLIPLRMFSPGSFARRDRNVKLDKRQQHRPNIQSC